MVRITHYRSKCIGCNACVEANPERWRISKKDGKSQLIGAKEKKGSPPHPSQRVSDSKLSRHKNRAQNEIYHYYGNDFEYEENIKAANNCPVKIIKITKT